ncbi:MAG: cobalt ECF transporter T component CbiQ [Planctomycetaceae bacterium]|nr:cobalt ECF transporter T component CbiQ [Planctomycetaceae bacterium]
MTVESGPTVCHRLPAGLKLLLVALVIAAGLAIPAENWPAHGMLAALVFAGHTFAGIPLRYLLRRLALFLPLLLTFALSLPLSQGGDRGWELGTAIALRGSLAFLSMLWLIHVLPFPQLLATLRRYHCPSVLLAMMAFMYRFSFLLFHEVERMTAARRARSFGRTGFWFRWKVGAQVIGMLLIRSMRRAERVHGAMLARGWTGDVRVLEDKA